MTRCSRKLSAAAALIAILLLSLSCSSPLTPAGLDIAPPGDGAGNLIVQITSSIAQSLLPPIDLNPASYIVSGTGPDSGTFSQPGTSSPIVVPNLKYGSWSVTVEALNSAGEVIGSGQATTTVQTGQNTALGVVVRPLGGPGTLSLTVLWNPAGVGTPSISAQLVPTSGSTLNLNFSSATAGTATYSSPTVPAGYYTLVLQLLDADTLVMGAVETVRIVKGQVTSGTFDFQQVNEIGGQITVNITPEMSNPLSVTLGGQAAQLAQGSAMTVNASAPAGTGNVVYTWYLNGVAKATGQSYSVGSALTVGFYRLDVTGITADGKRAGSASHSFRVVAATTAQATLAWNPNSETDLAGYKLYYGTATGAYSSAVDVGNRTTHTLTGLVAGQSYYVTATAYDATGLESARSAELVFSAS